MVGRSDGQMDGTVYLYSLYCVLCFPPPDLEYKKVLFLTDFLYITECIKFLNLYKLLMLLHKLNVRMNLDIPNKMLEMYYKNIFKINVTLQSKLKVEN